MKKYFLLLLTAIFCICLLGCEMPPAVGGNNNNNTNNNQNQNGGQENPGGDVVLNENPKLNIEFSEMHVFFEKENPYTELIELCIYIGYYPQREITDPSMIAKLASIETLNDRGFIEYDGNEFTKVTIVNNHVYGEHPGDDNVYYHGTQYRVGTTHYFLVEPLCWKVLSMSENNYFLITDNIIDSRAFHYINEITTIDGKMIRPSDYETSAIREWLNGEFYNLCFTEEEKAMIQESVNINDAVDIIQGTDPFNPTVDKVFLLSYKEAVSAENGLSTLDSRRAHCSDYARAHGLVNVADDVLSSSNWWTRTGFEYTPLFPAMVKYDGTADNSYYPDGVNIGVRPAIRIIFDE